ncbi:MAG: excinuclease ABC subunit UvrA [Gemmataceae bacterium]|nr:excinuclease ABC subunit UvrA [Gemmataceae bacterium]
MNNTAIVVRGAREHNLRGVDLDLPRDRLIVFTGVSGSGKSSLAFDTLYAEGQRRYIESLSSYARQFLGQLPKPDVDYLGGLSPAISIQQKTAGRNPRSTVGTITEVYDFLRVLYARVGTGHCPECQRPIEAQSRDQIVSRILGMPAGTRFLILAPVVRGQKGEFKDLCSDLLRRGYVRARIDGRIVRLGDDQKLDKRLKHDIEVVVDRLTNEPRNRGRIAEAVEQALGLAESSLIVAVDEEEAPGKVKEGSKYQDTLYSSRYSCGNCQLSFEEPTPQLFSFNSPHGMCPDCDGLGTRYTFDTALLIPDPSKSFYDGAVLLVGPLRGMGRWRKHIYNGVADTLGIDLKKPWKNLPQQHQDWLLNGSGDKPIVYSFKHRGGLHKHGGKWEGIVPQLLASFKKTAAGPRRMQLEKYMTVVRCPTCSGQRLNAQARAVRVAGKSLVEACADSIGNLAEFFSVGGPLEVSLDPVRKHIAGELLKEIRARLGFLNNVGLHYLSLDRSAPTLSGGEAQRIRLAGQIGSGLVGVLYILDEPSIGLHPRDNERLLRSIERLRDVGNTVVVVEHDEETIRAADYVVDFGPGPGVRGGEVVAAGTYSDVAGNAQSLTGRYLSGKSAIIVPKKRRPGNGHALGIKGARHHNLKNIDVEIPLGCFVGVTGVSGSGKSSLINDILLHGIKSLLQKGEQSEDEDSDSELEERVDFDGITGSEHIDKVIAIDQSAIGRTPRSNPGTYIKVLDEIRGLFAMVTDAKTRGYQAGRFSFNRPGGRCEACEGNGSNRLEMDFLADVWVTCPVCGGKRFNHETLQVRYRGKSIHDVLEMDIQEALVLFEHVPKVRAMLQTLHEVGLDYIKLGQPSPTLSGGEAQRIKLARELCRRGTGKTLYVLDEPTTGLHFEDVRKLLEVLHKFVDEGNTVLVIEHNLDVIKTADWVIDLGPEGGQGGGRVVAAGTPEKVARCTESFTGKALVAALGGRVASRKIDKKKVRKPELAAIDEITVEGAREHNLKDVSTTLPRGKMTVCSGPSGSGKSSLAIDTVYAEGQRRYVESLSSYARQFLGQVQKPRVDRVEGLSPAVSIEQKTTSKSPRSTVGTVTEIFDYLRVLFARLGVSHCPKCGTAVGTQSADEIIEKVMALPDGARCYVLAPVVRRGQEKFDTIFADIRRAGFNRVRIDGVSYALDDVPSIDQRRKHTIEAVVDRIVVRAAARTRIADAIEQGLALGQGVIRIAHVDNDVPEHQWRVDRFSQHLSCESCGRSLELLSPHNFSFNSPLGWCPGCEGLGTQAGASLDLLIRDPRLTLAGGAIAAWPETGTDTPWRPFADAIAIAGGFTLDTAFSELPPAKQRIILYGTGDKWLPLPEGTAFQYKGIVPAIDEATRVSWVYRTKLEHLTGEVPCSACAGARLRDDAAAVRFQGKTLGELCDLPVSEALSFFRKLKLDATQKKTAGELLREISDRLEFLVEVGLDYLTLGRQSPTLSGGEAQRIRLASQIGSGLTGVLYVLDEPTIGLHPRDNKRLLAALQKLRDLGNTLLLVEHDREVIFGADHLLDFGPGAGDRGGEIVAAGSPRQLAKSAKSLTGKYLSGRMAIPVPTNRRVPGAIDDKKSAKKAGSPPPALRIDGARHHNLKGIDVTIPLGALVAVTGVSGSGKSSLVHEVLHDTLARRLHRAKTRGAAHDAIRGLELIDKVISVDQNPLGNTPMSNPATFTGVFDLIRQLFAQLPESRVRGYQPRRFSFNKAGGRCEACEGNGQKKIEMHFLPDVWVTCDVCEGARFNPETLAVRYKGKSISDVLNLRVCEALELFSNIPKIRRILQTLADVGLDYVALGQAAPTLSGGEAQRVKLAGELGRPNTGKTLYILDEPTTGLHFDDVRKLLEVLHRLVDLGNTVVVIEHNLDMIKNADWVIDLGPEAGDAGGYLVAQGTPESISRCPNSHTGAVLKEVLDAGPHEARARFDPTAQLEIHPDDVALETVGKDIAPPWESDGRRWHTQDRLSYKGTPCVWEGAALTHVERLIQESAEFGPTIWTERSVVEIPAKVKSHGWFLHAMTSGERLLRLVFRVGRNTFKQEALARQLNLRPLNELEGVSVFGDESRVRVSNRRGPVQDVTLMIHRKSEVETPAFTKFLKQAISAFQAHMQKVSVSPEDVMPWKVNGERWHLGEKGFPPGKKVYWDRRLLGKLLNSLQAGRDDVTVKWDVRDAVTLRASEGAIYARVWTKRNESCDVQLYCAKGKFNLSRVESIGAARAGIVQDKSSRDTIELSFLLPDHVDARKLSALVNEICED